MISVLKKIFSRKNERLFGITIGIKEYRASMEIIIFKNDIRKRQVKKWFITPTKTTDKNKLSLIIKTTFQANPNSLNVITDNLNQLFQELFNKGVIKRIY